jgi:hypothetical protein
VTRPTVHDCGCPVAHAPPLTHRSFLTAATEHTAALAWFRAVTGGS